MKLRVRSRFSFFKTNLASSKTNLDSSNVAIKLTLPNCRRQNMDSSVAWAATMDPSKLQASNTKPASRLGRGSLFSIFKKFEYYFESSLSGSVTNNSKMHFDNQYRSNSMATVCNSNTAKLRRHGSIAEHQCYPGINDLLL